MMTIRTHGLWPLCAMIVVAMSSDLFAQVTQIIEGGNRPWTYKFVVDPASEVQPALKYRLLPDQMMLRPGDASSFYHRALRRFSAHSDMERKEFDECLAFGLMIRPASTDKDHHVVAGVSIDRVKTLITTFSDVLVELNLAANREYCDWGLGFREKDGIETINLQFDEFYLMRSLARLLQMKARVAIVDHDYDEAFRVIQMSFQLGRDVSQCPFIITGLIGTAIAVETQVVLMEIIAQPGSPNLYWALAMVPMPLIDVRPGVENELNLALKFPLVREADRPHTSQEWKDLFGQSIELVRQLRANPAKEGGETETLENPASWNSLDLLKPEFARVKEELVRLGLTADQISAMPVLQLIAAHESRLVRCKRDETLKLIRLPFHQAAQLLERIEKPGSQDGESNRLSDFKEVVPLYDSLRPFVGQALHASIRLDCRLARLQVVEALRLHATANRRKFPESLAEVTLVPIPLNPITGKPITYSLDGETAVLEFPSSNSIANYGEITRVTLRKED
ncbi:hypothetical protein [Schlesneria paludicola]|uniref:hypothetical protein n=1 Tax=Schlesneria paludicola TaxID=360056 RepID=UPI000299D565|nr:hypothetical protein [Schlesneria paludicola]